MIVIFIAGASASGKSTFAKKLMTKFVLENRNCFSLSMDDYYKEIPEGIDPTYYRNNTNFDAPNCYDFELLSAHLIALNAGDEVVKPIFDFVTNKRLTFELVRPKEVLIIEGLFALTFAKQLSRTINRMTVAVHVDSYSSLMKKRIQRDTTERSRNEWEVRQQESKYVGPGFFNIIAKSVTGADFHVLNKISEGGSLALLDTDADEIFNYYQDNYVIKPSPVLTL